MARSGRELSPSELGDFVAVEPPALLDQLVQARVADVLADRRAQLPAARPCERAPNLAPRPVEARPDVTWADAWARVIWRAMAG